MKDKKDYTGIPKLKIQSDEKELKSYFEHNDATYIIVEDANLFKGVILKEDFYANKKDITQKWIEFIKPVYLQKGFTLFDWFKLYHSYKLESFPLVNQDLEFLKVINQNEILDEFLNSALDVQESSVLILRKETAEFSYSEVFQIAETNAAKIYASYISHSDENYVEIILNLFHINLNELLQSYRRFEYEIVSVHAEDLHHETLKANSEYFSKYLTV